MLDAILFLQLLYGSIVIHIKWGCGNGGPIEGGIVHNVGCRADWF